MHVIYDNLLAILVSGFLLTVLMQLSLDSNETRVDSTRYYANRIQSTAFIETLQRDLRNLGAGVDAAQPMITGYSWGAFPKTFEFKASLDPTQPTVIDEIKYEIDVVSSLHNSCGVLTCYQINRYRKVGGSYTLDGGSPSTITDFDLILRDGDGAPVGAGSLDNARQIDVSITTLSAYGDNDLMKHTRWKSRLQPANLSRKDN